MEQPTKQAQDASRGPLSRRKLFAGATGIGAVAVAASMLPGIVKESGPAAPVKAAPLKGGGYTLSEHVKQYYKSALI
jgi:hypothetical protein